MKSFNDAKRRTTQQVLQSLGVVKGTEDSKFQEEVEEFRNIVNNVKSLQNAMRTHLLAIQKQQTAAAALAKELSNFYKGTPFEENASKFYLVQEEIEKVQLAAFEKLYQEKAISAVDEILWEVPELEERIKHRKGLLLDYDAHVRKYESAKASLAAAQSDQSSSSHGHTSIRFGASAGTSLFSRKKSETDLSEDVAIKKLKVEQAESVVNEVTNSLRERFNELFTKKSSGEILRNSTNAIFACENHLFASANSKLESIEEYFPDTNQLKAELENYESNFAKLDYSSLSNSALAGPSRASIFSFESGKKKAKQEAHVSEDSQENKTTTNISNPTKVFGVSLASMSSSEMPSTPSIVYDCIDYLDKHDGINVEGIFRIPGAQDTVLDVKRLYDSNVSNVDLDSFPGIECHDVGTLLKMFFRELPEPLIPSSLYEPLVAAAKVASKAKPQSTIEEGDENNEETQDHEASQQGDDQNREDKATEICNLVMNLPPQHIACLGVLLHFLHKISTNSAKNKMNTANLATCFAPSLIRAPESVAPQAVLYDIQYTILVVKILIEKSDVFPNLPRPAKEQPKLDSIDENAPAMPSNTVNFIFDGDDNVAE